jgi:hypothetical protein
MRLLPTTAEEWREHRRRLEQQAEADRQYIERYLEWQVADGERWLEELEREGRNH